MKLIKIDATDSTNDYLKKLIRSKPKLKDTAVLASKQIKGRGQLGSKWQSQEGLSLTFSVFKNLTPLEINRVSSLMFVASLGLIKALEKLRVPNLSIKWPNDIMSDSKKLAGILIENQIHGRNVVSTIVGIGLNVNEQSFHDLPNATSMSLSAKRQFDLMEVFQQVITEIETQFQILPDQDYLSLKNKYEKRLFKKDVMALFQTSNNTFLEGCIRGVNVQGEILIESKDGELKRFQLKEISYLY